MASYTIKGSAVTSFVAGDARSNTAIVGTSFSGNSSEVVTCRYSFTTDGYGATALRFRTSNATATVRGSSSSDDSVARMRFALSTNPTAYATYKGSDRGTAITSYSYGHYVEGSLSVRLMPRTTYYLWIFPAANFSSYTRFDLGSCSLTTSGSYGKPSSLSVSDGLFGEETVIQLSRSVSGVTHTVTVSCAGRQETLIDKSDQYPTIRWTPELTAYAALLPNAGSAQASVSVSTWYGDTLWGSESKTVTLRFPDTALNPELSAGWCSLSPDNSNTSAAAFSVYIQGYSRVRATFDPARIGFQAGASLAAYSLRLEGQERQGESPLSSQTISAAGQLTLHCAVIDSRGHSAGADFTVEVLPYSRPNLSGLAVFRCDDQGLESQDGQYLSVRATADFAPLNGLGGAQLLADWKRPDAQDFGQATVIVSGQANLIGPFNPDLSYRLRLRCVDVLQNTAELLYTVNTRRWAMKFNASGTAVGFGKAPESDRALELPHDWKLLRRSADSLSVAHAVFTDDAAWSQVLARLADLEAWRQSGAT